MSAKKKPLATSVPKPTFAGTASGISSSRTRMEIVSKLGSKDKLLPQSSTSRSKPTFASTASGIPSSSRTRMETVSKLGSKDKLLPQSSTSRSQFPKSSSKVSEEDTTMSMQDGFPEFDEEHRRIAYGKFLRSMLEDCLVDEKIKREETQMDIQMALLADRFQKTIDQLDKTNRRLKNINFATELNRLKVLKSNHCDDFYSATEKLKAEEILRKLNKQAEQTYFNKLHTSNVDFGFKEESGHQQLLDAVNDAIEGLEEIKKNSNLDLEKFKEYHQAQTKVDELESDRLDLASLKNEYEDGSLTFNEQLIREVSERIAKCIVNDEENDDSDD